MRKKLRIQSEQEGDSRYLDLSFNPLASAPYKDIPYPSVQAVQSIVDFIAPEDAKRKSLDPRSFAQVCFLRELDGNVLIKTLYGNYAAKAIARGYVDPSRYRTEGR